MMTSEWLQELKSCSSKEALLRKIMTLQLPPFEEAWRCEENLVIGCQSIMHLKSVLKEGKIYFFASSDALISRGLAALLIYYYNGKSPEEVLKLPPTFIKELGIPEMLSPGRANGLHALHLKMKKQALAHLVAR